jgi:hypothetical protein
VPIIPALAAVMIAYAYRRDSADQPVSVLVVAMGSRCARIMVTGAQIFFHLRGDRI